jgi:hypothetical protein
VASQPGSVAQLQARLLAARERLRLVPVIDSHAEGPPDPESGERWDRHQVLGHMAEFLPYWSANLGHALEGGRIGREPGSTGRRDGIESGEAVAEEELRRRVEDGCDAAAAFLLGVADADLRKRPRTVSGGRITLRRAIENYLVGHLEAHVAQLEEVTARGSWS